MSSYAKILSLSYDSVVATKASALKSHYRSVRLVKDGTTENPLEPSYVNNILLNGKCIDPETRCLYVFYIDTYFGSAWIIEINIDTRVQTVVYYDKYNVIGFNPLYKIRNPRVVYGKLVWTDDLNPIYQMDIARAKKSFLLGIGYGQYPQTVEWDEETPYGIDQIVSNGNKYYKSLVDANYGIEPKDDDGTNWLDLKCLIEDAYYSMNVKNFYFEATPPKHPPVVIYQSDDTRKINNLRQTLFQVAYRYVYIDWRKSTFSPASIVPLPQAEEETATGLANEIISLNNKLQIVVNTGGEEVRAIEVIGRSSHDTSKWFLIDTINKFSTQERGNEISKTTEADMTESVITIPDPIVINESVSLGDRNNMGLAVGQPFVILTYIASYGNLVFNYYDGGIGSKQEITIDCSPTFINLISYPPWISVRNTLGFELFNGEVVAIYPTTENPLYTERSGSIVMRNDYGDSSIILVSQGPRPLPPPTPITCIVEKDPLDVSPLVLSSVNTSAFTRSSQVTISFFIENYDYGDGVQFLVKWRAIIGSSAGGSGSFNVLNNRTNAGIVLSLNRELIEGDVVGVYLSTEDIGTSFVSSISSVITPLNPNIINSWISASPVSFSWLATEYGIPAGVKNCNITVKPSQGYIDSKPAWLTIMRGSDPLLAGMSVFDGDTLYLFPTVENIGGAKPSATVVFKTTYGDSFTIYVEQAAAIVIPPSEVTCSAGMDPSDFSGMYMSNGYGTVTSGSSVIRIRGTITYYGSSGPFILSSMIVVNGVLRGTPSIPNIYAGNVDFYIVADVPIYVGDEVRIYFMNIT